MVLQELGYWFLFVALPVLSSIWACIKCNGITFRLKFDWEIHDSAAGVGKDPHLARVSVPQTFVNQWHDL